MRVYGDDEGDQLGISSNSVAYGDVNGDGYDDLIVGAPETSSGTDAGEVVVVFGSATRPSTTVDLHAADGANGETRILGDDVGDHFGYAVASADLNHDGYDDIIAGAYGAATAGGAGAGQAYIVYGSAGIGGTIVNLDSTPGSNGETRVRGESEGAGTGNSLGTGDFNGDGLDDLAIGGSLTLLVRDQVVIVYGSGSLPGTILEYSSIPGSFGETRILGDDLYDGFGNSLASGDVNGDGIDDLIAGAQGADFTSRPEAGEVYVIYGKSSLPGDIIDLDSTPGSNGETRILGNQTNLGASVASGDINGDGFDEVLTGAPGDDPFGRTNLGITYLIYGSASLPGASKNMFSAAGSEGETRYYGHVDWNGLGTSVAVGDLNGDGRDEMMTAAAGTNFFFENGEVFIVYGAAGTLTSLDFNTDSPRIDVLGFDSEALQIGAGATGDLNRDGYGDCTVSGINGDNPLPGGQVDVGFTATIFGGGTAASATVLEPFKSGNAPLKGLGGRLSPVLRTRMGFSGGTAGVVTGTITRSDSSISGLGTASQTANVLWQFSTTRTGFTSASLKLQYVDSEIAGLTESNLKLYRATSASGPWSLVSGATLDLARNEVSATTSALGYFALSTVDLVAPTADSITTPNAGPTNADSLIFTVSFSEPVQGFNAAADLLISHTGTANSGVTISGGPQVYAVTINGITGNGSFTLAVNTASDVRDLAGNALGSSVTSSAVSIDNAAPTLSAITPLVPNPTNANVALVTVAFNSPVQGFSLADLSITGAGATYTGATVTGGPQSYTLNISGIAADGTITVAMAPGNDVQDAAGNALAPTTTTAIMNIDNTPPQAIALQPETTGPTNADTIIFTAQFSEPVLNFDAAADILVAHVGTSNAGAAVSGGPQNYTVALNGLAGDGTFALSVRTTTGVRDPAGNVLAASVQSEPVELDNTPPGISGISAAPPEGRAGEVVTVSFLPSEAVVGNPVVTVNGNGAVRSSSSFFDYAYTINEGDPVGPAVVQISAVDAAGNTGTASSSSALTVLATPPRMPLAAWPALAALTLIGALRARQR